MIKIAVIGPESSGKSDLSKAIANHYKGVVVEEFSREFLTRLGRAYTENDLVDIAKGQVAAEKRLSNTKPIVLVADTDMHVMKVWSEHKYGSCDSWILNELDKQKFDLYLLTSPDIPYEKDPLRENPNERVYFFDIYHQLLKSKNRRFIIVKGNRMARLASAIEAIDPLL